MTYRLHVLSPAASGLCYSAVDKTRKADAQSMARKLSERGCEVIIQDTSRNVAGSEIKRKIENMKQRAKPPFDDPIPF